MFNYYLFSTLPVGKPEIVVKNLDSWGADEIILLIRMFLNKPDYRLIENFRSNIRTPLIYGGGIKNVSDAVKCIKHGSDRVVVNQIYLNNISQIQNIEIIGKESSVLSLN